MQPGEMQISDARSELVARDVKIWDRIQRRQATATWLDHDMVVREFAAERGIDNDADDGGGGGG